MKKLIFLGFVFVLLLQNNALSLELKKTIRAEYIMGTIFTILVYSEEDNLTEKGINEAFKEIRKYDSILSNYKNDSEINTVLKDAYKKPIKISNELYDVINDCLFFSKLTDGKFDITIEPLVKLWGFKNKNFKKPTLAQINKVKKDIGYKNIILDPKYHTLYIKNKNITLDFGAIGKGYAIGKAANILKLNGIKSAFIDSVSNQYYLGTPPNQPFWKVGIKDPRNEDKIIKTIEVKDKAVSTSGDYENYFFDNGIRYSHIIDPISGYPIKDSIASTIVCENSGYADALSTSFLLIDEKKQNEINKKLKIDYFVVFKNQDK